jgi:hypothetical protein
MPDILRWFVRRWSIEVTFAEVRRHLGVETQHQWSDPAIARTTPALLGLFSLITLWAHDLSGKAAPTPRATSWLSKAFANLQRCDSRRTPRTLDPRRFANVRVLIGLLQNAQFRIKHLDKCRLLRRVNGQSRAKAATN